jgi:hypothetical protein
MIKRSTGLVIRHTCHAGGIQLKGLKQVQNSKKNFKKTTKIQNNSTIKANNVKTTAGTKLHYKLPTAE